MGATPFPHGLASMGVPVWGHIPAIAGQYYFVNPNTTVAAANPYPGNNGNTGKELTKPFATLLAAYSACVSGKGDGIIVLSNGTTAAQTSSYLSAAITWSKHGITAVGVCAPVASGQRARIASAATATTLAKMITVSGNNNAFLNLQVGNWGSGAAALGGIDVTGSRNYFRNVHIVGAGHATPAQLTGSYSLQLSGATENTFDDCVIGIDTVDQDGSQAATGVIKFASGCQSNYFRRCEVRSYWSYASAICGAIHHVGAGDSITRTQYFEDCKFANFKLGLLTTTPPLSLVVGTAPNNGVIWMTGKTAMLGYAAYDGTAANDRVFVSMPATNLTGGLSVVTA